MYINDLPSRLHYSHCLMFADDVKFFKRVSSIEDCHELQTDLNSIADWCSEWNMKLNFTKCFFIIFSLKRVNDILSSYCVNNNFIHSLSEIKDLVNENVHACGTLFQKKAKTIEENKFGSLHKKTFHCDFFDAAEGSGF